MTASGASAGSEPAFSSSATVATIVALAFVLRFAWGLAADVTPGTTGPDDAAWYRATALQLMKGNGYVNPFTGHPTAVWPPGYSATLAVAYRLFGATTTTTVLVNAIAGALTCWLLWLLGRRLVGARTAVVGTALLACFPSHVYFAALTLSESVCTLLGVALLVAGVLLLVRDAGDGWWLVWGFAAGLITLVRSETLLWCVLPAAALLGRARFGRSARVLALTVLGMALALTPWTLRNFRVFGAFVPTISGAGRTLWAGHNPGATGGMTVADQRGIEAAMEAAGVSLVDAAGELATNRLLVGQAVAFALANPARELALVPRRVYHLFRGDHVWASWYPPGTPRVMPSETARRRLSRIGNAYYLAVGALALAGWFIRGWPAGPAWRLLDLFVLVSVTTFSITLGDPRYHHGLMPLACLMAAIALVRVAPGHHARSRAPAARSRVYAARSPSAGRAID